MCEKKSVNLAEKVFRLLFRLKAKGDIYRVHNFITS